MESPAASAHLTIYDTVRRPGPVVMRPVVDARPLVMDRPLVIDRPLLLASPFVMERPLVMDRPFSIESPFVVVVAASSVWSTPPVAAAGSWPGITEQAGAAASRATVDNRIRMHALRG